MLSNKDLLIEVIDKISRDFPEYRILMYEKPEGKKYARPSTEEDRSRPHIKNPDVKEKRRSSSTRLQDVVERATAEGKTFTSMYRFMFGSNPSSDYQKRARILMGDTAEFCKCGRLNHHKGKCQKIKINSIEKVKYQNKCICGKPSHHKGRCTGKIARPSNVGSVNGEALNLDELDVSEEQEW